MMVKVIFIKIIIIATKMIRIMIIIGQECPVPAGGQMGSVWKWRLLMNTPCATQNSATHCVLYIV